MEVQEEKVWFAMRATYRRELVAKSVMDANSIDSFIPMQYHIRIVRGKKKRILEPAIHNLIFVYCRKSLLQKLKAELPYLQYMTAQKDGKRIPIVVPEKQMYQFMRISETYDEKLMYIPYDSSLLAKGAKVRINAGPFEGMEGRLVRFDGMRNKRLVVSIDGILSVSTASIPMDCIDILK